MGHAKKERVLLFGTDQRITSGPAAKRPHSKAEYMTAPERFADSQIPLAPRAPKCSVAGAFAIRANRSGRAGFPERALWNNGRDSQGLWPCRVTSRHYRDALTSAAVT